MCVLHMKLVHTVIDHVYFVDDIIVNLNIFKLKFLNDI